MNETTPKACAPDCPCPCHGDADEPGPHLPTCAFADPDYVPEGFEEAMRAIGREMAAAAAEAFGVSPDKVHHVWAADYRVPATAAPDGPGSVPPPPPSSGVAVNVPAAVLANDVRGVEVSEVQGAPLRLVGADRAKVGAKPWNPVVPAEHLAELGDAEIGMTRDMLTDPAQRTALVQGVVEGVTGLASRPRCMVTKIVSDTLEVRCRRERHDDQTHDFGAGLEEAQDRQPKRSWFLTLTGRQFFYDDPHGYAYEVSEIAHALGMNVRFNGHLRKFYSVAEHSVHVARVVEAEGRAMGIPEADLFPICRGAMMHDASEAFLADVPRPQKRLPAMRAYRFLEECVQVAILRQLGLEAFHDRDVIKRADASVLRAEKDQIRDGHGYQSYDAVVEPAKVTILSLMPWDATALFLEEWLRFGGTLIGDRP